MSAEPCTSQQSDLHRALRTLAAGGLASTVSKTTVAPMDRVKLLLQLQNAQTFAANSKNVTMNGSKSAVYYEGIADCFRKICAEQGVRALWRGNMAGVGRCFPTHALNFVMRDHYRLLFLNNVDKKRQHGRFVFGNIAAGGAGAATALCFLYPLDLARTRLAVESKANGAKKFDGMFSCLKSIYGADGVVGVYRGFLVSLQFVVVSRAAFFGLFDTARGHLEDGEQKLNFFTMWLLAQVSLVTSGYLTYPMDTVRRLMMLQAGKTHKEYSSSMDCLVRLAKSRGVKSLYNGALSNSLRATGGALMVALYYEAVKYI